MIASRRRFVYAARMEATLAEFRRRFSEFDKTDDVEIEFALEEAKMLHNVRPLATLLACAHLLKISEGDPLGSTGEIRHSQAGSAIVSYAVQAERGREAFWTSTTYGRRFLMLERRSHRTGAGSVVVA